MCAHEIHSNLLFSNTKRLDKISVNKDLFTDNPVLFTVEHDGKIKINLLR